MSAEGTTPDIVAVNSELRMRASLVHWLGGSLTLLLRPDFVAPIGDVIVQRFTTRATRNTQGS